MKELILTIEEALGPDRLTKLRNNEDAYQQFWLGVLEAMSRADLSKETVGYLISSGYGSIRNMRRAENSKGKMRTCSICGVEYGYRTKVCRYCGAETDSSCRVSSTTGSDGGEIDFEDRTRSELDFTIDISIFLETLTGNERYIAKRWLVDRADLLFANHTKQIAFELDLSSPRVAQIKTVVRQKFKDWYWKP